MVLLAALSCERCNCISLLYLVKVWSLSPLSSPLPAVLRHRPGAAPILQRLFRVECWAALLAPDAHRAVRHRLFCLSGWRLHCDAWLQAAIWSSAAAARPAPGPGRGGQHFFISCRVTKHRPGIPSELIFFKGYTCLSLSIYLPPSIPT